MEIKVLEKTEEKVKLEVNDTTFVNLLHEKLWELGKVDYSAWSRDHPYLSSPVLLVKAKDPKAALLAAAEKIAIDAEKIRKNFEKEK